MYVPAHFKEDDPAELRRVMREYSFATLVTVDEAGLPFATHLPMIIDDDDGPEAGLYLRTHLARANPQWHHFANGREVLAIFHGPHALVHSNWYDSSPNVPTWNYIVVHAHGPVRFIEDPDAVRAIAYRLVAQHTPDMHPIPAEYESRLLKAVVSFELRVTRLEGKFKLNQNRTAADRQNVIAVLGVSADQGSREIAQWMERR